MSESKLEEKKYYHDNGQLKKHYYKDDKLHGECKWWYENGQIGMHAFYLNNKRHGEHKVWYNNGQIATHTFYNNGKRHGECKEWYDNGQIEDHAFYKDDKQLSKYTWNCLIKVQRAYRIKYNLKKYFRSKSFVEWWYHPDMPGGKVAKKELESFVDSF